LFGHGSFRHADLVRHCLGNAHDSVALPEVRELGDLNHIRHDAITFQREFVCQLHSLWTVGSGRCDEYL